MKVWRYYFKPDENDSNKRYDLYAITNDKSLAKQFEKERNMDKFIKRCTNEDRETYADVANDNRASVLNVRSFVTRTVLPNGTIQHTDADILCTDYEYQTIKDGAETASYVTTEDYWWHASKHSYMAFKNKIINALRLLEYVAHYKLYNLSFDVAIDPDDDDYSAPDLWIDEVGVFISTFKDTFK